MLTQTPTGSINLQASFANEAELTGYPYAGAYPQGWEVYVVATDRYYTYYPAGTTKGSLAAQIGIVVAPTVGGGAFVANATNGIQQAAFAEISANTTVAVAAGFVDLLTVTMTTVGGILEIESTFSAENNVANGGTQFQITLDGANIGPGAFNGASSLLNASANSAQSGAIRKRKSGVAAGAHTIKLRWNAAGAASTSTINVTANLEHATLVVKEVAL